MPTYLIFPTLLAFFLDFFKYDEGAKELTISMPDIYWILSMFLLLSVIPIF